MSSFLYLPEISAADLLLKGVILAAAAILAWWLVTLLLVQVFGGRKGDLAVALCGFVALLIVFFLLQLYSLLTLNYNLSEFGTDVMKERSFYARFIPELLTSILLLSLMILNRSRILEAIGVEKEAEA